jgi:MYXO-CTERM domain-containing protein
VALAVVVAVCGPARAFYWYDWPGSGLRAQESLITQPKPQESVQPLPNTPGRDQPPPLGPPVPVDKPPVGPHPTPEPATGLLGLLGLGALAVRRWRMKAHAAVTG